VAWTEWLLVTLAKCLWCTLRPSSPQASTATSSERTCAGSRTCSGEAGSSTLSHPTSPKPVQPGDRVTALHLPHYGVGVVELVEPDGGLLVAFEVDGRESRDAFDQGELQLVVVAKAVA
jgi:hypothetical protein